MPQGLIGFQGLQGPTNDAQSPPPPEVAPPKQQPTLQQIDPKLYAGSATGGEAIARQQFESNPYNVAQNQQHQQWKLEYGLNEVLKQAPYLQNHPEILYAIANNQDPAAQVNPQDVAGVLKAQEIYNGFLKAHQNQSYSAFHAKDPAFQTGILRLIGGGIQDVIQASGLSGYERAVPPTLKFVSGALQKPVEWLDWIQKESANTEKSVRSNGGAGGIVGAAPFGAISGVASFLRDSFDTPAHFYRYYETVQKKYGTDAAIQAVMPSLIGAGVGVAGAAALSMTPGAEELAPEVLAGGLAESGAVATDTLTVTKLIQQFKDAAEAVRATAESGVGTDTAAYARYAAAKLRVEEALAPLVKGAQVGTKAVGTVANRYSLAGAEVGAQVGARAMHGDIWDATRDGTAWAKANPELDATLGEHLFGKGSFASGATDFLAAMGGPDALGVAGSFVGKARSAEGVSLMGRNVWGGTAFDNVDAMYENSSKVKRAIDQIVQHVDEGNPSAIARIDKSLGGKVTEVLQAAKGKTPEETLANVKDAFKQMAGAAEIFSTGKLPMSSALMLAARKAGFSTNGVFSFMPMYHDFSGAVKEWGIRTKDFTLGDTSMLTAMNNGLRQIGFNRVMADQITDHLYQTKDLAEWKNVYQSVIKGKFQTEFVKAVGGKSLEKTIASLTPEGLTAFMARFDAEIGNVVDKYTNEFTGYGGVTEKGPYGLSYGSDGGVKQLGVTKNGSDVLHAALYEGQLGRLTLPDYRQFNKDVHGLVEQFGNNAAARLYAAMEGLPVDGERLGPVVAKMVRPYGLTGLKRSDSVAPFGVEGEINTNILPPPSKAEQLIDNIPFIIDRGKGMTNTGVEFMNRWVNDKVFKPMALATGGWATRVSSAEILLNAMRQGPINLSLARLAAAGARHERAVAYWGKELDRQSVMDLASRTAYVVSKKLHMIGEDSKVFSSEQEMGSFVATLHGIMAGVESSILKGLNKQEFMDAAIKSLYLNDGHVIPPTVEGGHAMVNDTSAPRNASAMKVDTETEAWYHRTRGSEGGLSERTAAVKSDEYAEFHPGQDGYVTRRLHQANLQAADPAMRYAIPKMRLAYLDNVKSGMTREEAYAAAEEVGMKAHEEFMMKQSPGVRQMFARQNGWTDPNWMKDHPDATPEQAHAQAAIAGLKPTLVGEHHIEHLGGHYVDDKLFKDMAANSVKDKSWQEFHRAYHMGADGTPLPKGYFGPVVGGALGGRFSTNWTDSLSKLGEVINTRATGKIVTRLAREPIFIVDYANALKALDKHVASGLLTTDQANTKALAQATYTMSRFIHNPADKLRFESSMRFVAPFYFAQNQSWRRIARLAAADPGAFERYARTQMQVLNFEYQQGQAKGGYPTVNIPGSAWLTGTITGLMGASVPLPITASLDSASSVFPVTPEGGDAGDTFSSPSAMLRNLFPHAGPIWNLPIKYILPLASTIGALSKTAVQKTQDIAIGQQSENATGLQDVLPNSFLDHTIQTMAGWWGANSDGSNSLSKEQWMSSYITAANETWSYLVSQKMQGFIDQAHKDYNGTAEQLNHIAVLEFGKYYNARTGDGAQHLSELMSEVNRATATRAMLRSTIGWISPLSTSLGRANPTVNAKFQAALLANHGDWQKTQDQMMKSDPQDIPFVMPYNTSANIQKYNGVSYPETQNALNWIEANPYLVNKYPSAARWLMPTPFEQNPKNPYYQSAAHYAFANGMKDRRTPKEMQTAFNIQNGDYLFYNVIEPEFVNQVIANGKSSYAGYLDAKKWAQTQGPVVNADWNTSFNSGNSAGHQNRISTLDQIGQMLNDPQTQHLPETKELRFLYDGYVLFRDNQAQNYATSVQRGQVWSEAMDRQVKLHPNLQTFITTVLKPMYPYYPQGK